MDITIDNYRKNLSQELVKKSQRCLVRECDEVGVGQFEAYVDEGENTYDVSVTLKKSSIGSTSCECQSITPLCHHKIALLQHIAQGAKAPVKIAIKRKLDPIQQMLDSADPQALKSWIYKTVKKHKEINLSFLNEFSRSDQLRTPDELFKLTDDTVKAILNKKVNADATQAKKIVQLWGELHQNVLETYLAESHNLDYIERIDAILRCCTYHDNRIVTNSKQIHSYILQMLEKIGANLSNLHDDEAWELSTSYFISKRLIWELGLRQDLLGLITTVFTRADLVRRSKIVAFFVALLKSKLIIHPGERNSLLQFLLPLISDANEFIKYKSVFTPIKYAYGYNSKLIDRLIEVGDYADAENYCIDQMVAAHHQDYNLGYLIKLREIYRLTSNVDKLIGVLETILLKHPTIEDYLTVSFHKQTDLGFKKWRNKVFENARQLAYNDLDAAIFTFALLESENNFKGMLAYIDGRIDYQHILPYANVLIKTFPDLFVKKLLDKIDNQNDYNLHEYDPEKLDKIHDELFTIIRSKYSHEIIKLMISNTNKTYRAWSNLFVRYLVSSSFN